MAFDINETIQSQYGDSPHIKSVVSNYYNYLNPEYDINLVFVLERRPQGAVSHEVRRRGQ